MSRRCKIVRALNGKVLTVSQGQFKTRPGNLIMETYSNQSSQQFVLKPIVGSQESQVTIVSYGQQGRVVDVVNESKEVYKEIIVYEHHGRLNQRWMVIALDNGFIQLMSMHSGLVLEVQGGIDADGVGVVQNTNYKNRSQVWRFEEVKP